MSRSFFNSGTLIVTVLPEAYEGACPSTNITNQSNPVIGKGGLEHSGLDLDPESDPDQVGSVTFWPVPESDPNKSFRIRIRAALPRNEFETKHL
jgi:hypothetical protein